MTHSMLEDHFQLFDFAGKMVAEWKSKIDEMHTGAYAHPYPHVAPSTSLQAIVRGSLTQRHISAIPSPVDPL